MIMTTTVAPPPRPHYDRAEIHYRYHYHHNRKADNWWDNWWPFLLGLLLACCLILSIMLCFVKRLKTKKLVYMPVGDEERDTSHYTYTTWQEEDIARGNVVTVEFIDNNGNVQLKYFGYREHGMTFTEHPPIRVRGFEFNSYAGELGVQVNWTIVRIGNHEVSRTCSQEELIRVLNLHFQHLPPYPLRMCFDSSGNGTGILSFDFHRQPLGIEWSKTLPIRVEHFKPDSYAHSCGVREGWTVQKIGNVLMSPSIALPQFLKYLNDGLAHLPQEAKGMRMDFVDLHGCRRVFYFQRQPLGIRWVKHGADSHIRVEGFEFNSHAQDMGVQIGWTCVRIGDTDIESHHTVESCNVEISRHVASLALWPIRIDFHIGNSVTKTIYFLSRPLGMDLTDHLPFKVKEVHRDSLALVAGVKVGWEVLRIGNQVISSSTTGSDVERYLKDGLAHLPENRVHGTHHFMAPPTNTY